MNKLNLIRWIPKPKKAKEDASRYQALSAIHIKIRHKKIEELDIDLRHIFESIPIEQVFDSDINECYKIMHLRCEVQKRLRR